MAYIQLLLIANMQNLELLHQYANLLIRKGESSRV